MYIHIIFVHFFKYTKYATSYKISVLFDTNILFFGYRHTGNSIRQAKCQKIRWNQWRKLKDTNVYRSLRPESTSTTTRRSFRWSRVSIRSDRTATKVLRFLFHWYPFIYIFFFYNFFNFWKSWKGKLMKPTSYQVYKVHR